MPKRLDRSHDGGMPQAAATIIGAPYSFDGLKAISNDKNFWSQVALCFWEPLQPKVQSEEEIQEVAELQPRSIVDHTKTNYATLFAEVLGSTIIFWLWPALFITAQMTTYAATGGREGFFGVVTGGVVESLTLDTGTIMRWHMFSASAMWTVGAIQFSLKSLRHGHMAWVHRSLGRLFLALWFTIAGPSSFYLSLYSGTGPSNAQISMTIFSVVSMETTVMACYYFWKGWQVARRRALGERTWKLHKTAIGTGIGFTMTILFQRHFQLALILLRKVVVLLASGVPQAWTAFHFAAESLTNGLLDHNVNLAISTCGFGFALFLLLDGPRSRFWCMALELDSETAEELFQDQQPSWTELLFWRSRIFTFLALRAWVTKGWTIDPNPVAAPI